MRYWAREELEQEYPYGSVVKHVDGEVIVLDFDEWDEWIGKQVGERKFVSEDDMSDEINRNIRNSLLSESDWTQTLDDPTGNKEAWATYRQALRDLPSHPDWPNVELPTPPEN